MKVIYVVMYDISMLVLDVAFSAPLVAFGGTLLK